MAGERGAAPGAPSQLSLCGNTRLGALLQPFPSVPSRPVSLIMCGCTSSLDTSSLFLSGTEPCVMMSLSKDYISWRWFLHWENYASLNWNVFRKLLCVCFLTGNAEGDLFASLIEQHLLGLEEKPFHNFSLSYPAFLWGPLPPPLLTLPVLQVLIFIPGRSARHSRGMFWALQHCWCISAVVFSFT